MAERAESSIVERRANGAKAVTVIGAEAVDFYVCDRFGVMRWSKSVANGPGAQRRRAAAAREQRELLEAFAQ